MSEEKTLDDNQSDLSAATENLKIEAEPKDSGDQGKTDKVKSKHKHLNRYLLLRSFVTNSTSIN